MEYLLALVDKIQQTKPLPIFANQVFVVQNAGMQHWLNMSLAQKSGISFNLSYVLPAQFLWKTLRALTYQGKELNQEPFSREALCWRIFELLADERVISEQSFAQVHAFIDDNSDQQQALKRYQLACQLADLYEQYLIFRPEWIDAWQQGHCALDSDNDNLILTEKWQAKIWQLLTEDTRYNPLELLAQAKQQISSKTHILPARINVFGLNALPPIWLEFLQILAEYTEVHVFHLNPCFNYWGDVVTEKYAMSQIEHWTQDHQLLNDSVGNPLLANLGQQGREFLVQLQHYSTVNIEAYSEISDEQQPITVLEAIQQDILSLTDARQSPKEHLDDSIVFTSAHSAMREVQGLHDWLLHRFNQDSGLTPKDVLVMCPQVEDYAPYINAVFSKGWQDIGDDIPPLPCSIADRTSKDSQPLVMAFTELLGLPDCRFQVSQIISWLKLSAVQSKFGLSESDIDKIINWVTHAAIHWGLDQSNKNQQLKTDNATQQFTWSYGLSRLLTGFAFSDQAHVYQDKLLLPDVEGGDAFILGKLYYLLECLQQFTELLTQDKLPRQWHKTLLELVDSFFDSSDENSVVIVSAIDKLLEYTEHASFDQPIGLAIVQQFLDGHFSQPDPGKQFMIGQVTFCSMLPMRSIPFKIIAILGLNDGVFPRQRIPFSFDLLSMAPSKLGDRSRRGDDRYLFLEALISARQHLYLSYQGRNIKNNKEKQSSVVLKELMNYLTRGYGWCFDGDKQNNIRQLTMQPYSAQNYVGQYPSFDASWLSIGKAIYQSKPNKNKQGALNDWQVTDDSSEQIELSWRQWLAFFQHPSRVFAQQQLSLYLDDYCTELADSEPFETDHLTRYLLKEQVLEALLGNTGDFEDDESLSHEVITKISEYNQLSGKFPDLPNTQKTIDKLIADGKQLANFAKEVITDDIESIAFNIALPSSQGRHIRLQVNLMISNDSLLFVRSSLPKGKDFIAMYCAMLIAQFAKGVSQEITEKLSKVTHAQGLFFNSKQQKLVHYRLERLDGVEQKLEQLVSFYLAGCHSPQLTNCDLALKVLQSRKFEQPQLESFWHGNMHATGLGQDPYIHYFWPQCPQLTDIKPRLEVIYAPIFAAFLEVKSHE